jgi:hypothetical protein
VSRSNFSYRKRASSPAARLKALRQRLSREGTERVNLERRSIMMAELDYRLSQVRR